MARTITIIHPGNIITYTLGHMLYTSVVLRVSGANLHGYLTVELYDLSTPDASTFPRATIDDPVELSINHRLSDLRVYDYNEYLNNNPELFV